MSRNRRGIDWDEVRGRLLQNQLALERALVADAARIESALERRAIQLACRRQHAGTVRTVSPALVFFLGEQRYGIELSELSGVVAFAKCTPVPEAPAEFLGVINLRGDIRVVAELSRVMGLRHGEAATSGYVLLIGDRGQEVGLRVDRLESIQLLRHEDWTSSGGSAGELSTRYVKAFTQDGLILLSTAALRSHAAFAGRVGTTLSSTDDEERIA